MKKLFLFASMFFLLAGLHAQDVQVGADQSFKASLDDYETFGWTKDIDQIPQDAVFLGPNGVYVFNNETTRAKIKKAIEFELNSKGYKLNETDPDMLVMYQVTEQPGELLTFNGYHVVGGEKVRTEENQETVEIAPGTLLINLIDAETGVVAWQGFASGILKPDMVNDEMKVRLAIGSIFEKFDHDARK